MPCYAEHLLRDGVRVLHLRHFLVRHLCDEGRAVSARPSSEHRAAMSAPRARLVPVPAGRLVLQMRKARRRLRRALGASVGRGGGRRVEHAPELLAELGLRGAPQRERTKQAAVGDLRRRRATLCHAGGGACTCGALASSKSDHESAHAVVSRPVSASRYIMHDASCDTKKKLLRVT